MKNKKVIFIGPAAIHNAFVAMDQYDFQIPVETIEEFNYHMASDEEDSQISRESAVILIFSRLYQENREAFAQIAAFYAPYALVGILTPAQDKDMIPRIEGHIKSTQREFEANPDLDYNSSAPIYFIDYQNPMPDLNQAMSEFAVDESVPASTRESIIEMLPEHYRTTLNIDNEVEELNHAMDDLYGEDDLIIPEPSEGSGVVIASTSSKGGSGKSTISMGLAAYLAESSRIAVQQGLEEKPLKICVVDLDTRDGQLGFLNGRTNPTIFHIYGDAVGNMTESIPESSIRKGIYTSDEMGVDFIFAPRRPRNSKEINPKFYANLIQQLRGMYDYIILDTSVNYLDELLEKVAYPMADKIILVTDMGIASIMGMARWVSETTRPVENNGSGIDPNKIGIVVNKVMSDVNMGYDKIKRVAQGLDIIGMVPSMPKLITHKANVNSLHEIIRDKSLNTAFSYLAESIVNDEYNLAPVPFDE